MSPRATASLAIAALARNKMRSLLTTLGVVIGVAAVIVMQALGAGASAYVGQAISGMGTNVLIILPGTPAHFGAETMGAKPFSPADLEALRRESRAVGEITPIGAGTYRVIAPGASRPTNVRGVSPAFFRISNWPTALGRGLDEQDERIGAQVCLVGKTVADALYGTPEASIGKTMRVHDVSCRVVGTIAPKGASAFGLDQDDIVFMPYSTFSRRILGSDRIQMMIASAVSGDRVDEAREQMVRLLRHRRHVLPGEDDDFAVRDPREVVAVLQTVTGTLTILLLGVAAISLLVGGIGIMNIMLVSVTERTREVGIRLAVGARASDILHQFLVEAVVLSVAGGLIGLALGVAGGFAVARGINLPFVIPTLAPPIAVAVSVLVGVAFGVFPARKASRLNPLAALRYE